MHIETLKIFCDVVDNQSFSLAASQNFITQSAVSLEQLLGKFIFSVTSLNGGGAKPAETKK